MRYKGRYIPDKYIEVAPYIVDIPRGDGITELMVLEAEEPKKEIQCFQWEFEKPKRPEKRWVMNLSTAACVAGTAAVPGLVIAPTLSTVIILVCLGWLGLVAFANK